MEAILGNLDLKTVTPEILSQSLAGVSVVQAERALELWRSQCGGNDANCLAAFLFAVLMNSDVHHRTSVVTCNDFCSGFADKYCSMHVWTGVSVGNGSAVGKMSKHLLRAMLDGPVGPKFYNTIGGHRCGRVRLRQ